MASINGSRSTGSYSQVPYAQPQISPSASSSMNRNGIHNSEYPLPQSNHFNSPGNNMGSVDPNVDRGPGGVDLFALQTQEERNLLDVIDALKDLDKTHELEIPELVVCGGQSVGKSSVLEALTTIPFPRGDGTCTQFVTEIQLRDSDKSSVHATIVPHHSRGTKDALRLKSFNRVCKVEDLEALIQDAKDAMDLKAKQIGSDVLLLKVQGPKLPRFTIVDLPGLVPGKASEALIVEDKVKNYIKNNRAIILAVIAASHDIENQQVLTMAKHADPEGRRTFGIITKPDRVDGGGERYWVDVARNEAGNDNFLHEGWHLILNRNGEEQRQNTSLASRNLKERRFFATQPVWNELPPEICGIQNLQKRLGKLLYKHTREHIPALKREIRAKREIHEAKIAQLSRGLRSPQEAVTHFNNCCNEMRKLASMAVDGDYYKTFNGNGCFALDGTNMRDNPWTLRTRLEQSYDSFWQEMKQNGCALDYVGDIYNSSDADALSPKFVEMLNNIRGQELPGQFQPLHITLVFQHASKKWQSIAEGQINSAYDHCFKFAKILLDTKLADFPATADRLLNGIADLSDVISMPAADFLQKVHGTMSQFDDSSMRNLSGPLHDLQLKERDATLLRGGVRRLLDLQRRQANKALKKLVEDTNRPVKTRNPQYAKEVHELFGIDLFNQHTLLVKDSPSGAPLTPRQVTIDTGLHTPAGRHRDHAKKMRDAFIVYYKIALNTFVDNVIVQVIERHLMAKFEDIFVNIGGLKEEYIKQLLYDNTQQERHKQLLAEEAKRDSMLECLKRLENL